MKKIPIWGIPGLLFSSIDPSKMLYKLMKATSQDFHFLKEQGLIENQKNLEEISELVERLDELIPEIDRRIKANTNGQRKAPITDDEYNQIAYELVSPINTFCWIIRKDKATKNDKK